MSRLRVSPSMLESYRLYTTEDWFDTDRMVAQITEPFIETPEMKLGTDVHRFIETGQPNDDLDHSSIYAVVADVLAQNPIHEMKGYMDIPLGS